MVFSSHLFIFVFAPLALGLYYALPRKARHGALALLSYLFYGWTNPAFCLLLLTSTAVDYVAALVIAGHRPGRGAGETSPLPRGGARSRRQRVALGLSLLTNLSLLGFFKYFDFAVTNWNLLAGALGIPEAAIATTLRVALPLGISFYTFQSLSYTIDVYRGDARALASFVDFACYVSMFPQLVAGPIIRFSEVADQLRERTHTLAKLSRGAAFVAVGLAKKVLLANPCGKVADLVFDASWASPLDAWTGLFAYAFQIYFDFSGYSDMAIGLGLMLGFAFPKNFDSPYRADSIADFWRRWHLSLSTFLRDYLFLPLAWATGRRLDRFALPARREAYLTYAVATLVTMTLAGLWHGAAWNFVAWGTVHGLLLVGERGLGRRSPLLRLRRELRVGVTFAVVLLTWVLFRAGDLPAARTYYGWLFGAGEPVAGAALIPGLVRTPYHLLVLGVAAAVVWGAPPAWTWTRIVSWPRAALAALLLAAALAALAAQEFNPFIYFIF